MDDPEPDKHRTLTNVGRAVMALLILGAGGALALAAVVFGKHAETVPPRRPVPDVVLVTAKAEDVKLELTSQGLVQAVTETRAAAEVPGRVVWVSPSWDAGATFKEGEELLKLDDTDYQAALANAKALASEATLAVKVEEERGRQAVRDWNKLATGTPDSDLVTRAPQLKAAQAREAAALAAVTKAELDLQRTVLRAPYNGRIRAVLTDVGSYAAPGAPLAEFYATDAYQVSLPLSLDDYTFLNSAPGTPLTLSAEGGGKTCTFPAAILRTGAEIERASRTIHIIAEIKPGENAPPLLLPGLFVKALLPGITLPKIIRLPRVCLLPGDRVAVASADHRLTTRAVTVIRTTNDAVFLSEGVQNGERVLATVLAVLTEGLEVHPLDKDSRAPAAVPANTSPAGQPQ